MAEERSLNEVEREVLRRTAAVHADLARAAGVARKNGTSYVVFGVLTALFALGGEPADIALAAVLVAVGLAARSGAKRLIAADPKSPQFLALGEIALLLAVIAYCVARMTVMRSTGAELAGLVGTTSIDIDIEELIDTTTNIVYPLIMLIAVLYQGGLAMYFRARRSAVGRYIDDTPAWAREIVDIVSPR